MTHVIKTRSEGVDEYLVSSQQTACCHTCACSLSLIRAAVIIFIIDNVLIIVFNYQLIVWSVS